ncbi:MAG: type VI secretion system tip protein VgrG [Verrucomicrobiae bacterium]|nr:type VI secretion system tip protein VgrG [Verrucomicrobiae bacterium]
MPAKQEHRLLALGTPLGPNVLLVQRLVGSETLGRLSIFHLDLLSEQAGISFDAIVGQNVTLRMEVNKGRTRYINGYVAHFSQSGQIGSYFRYQATVVPWLWFLTRTSDCRIFQEISVPNIIKTIFREKGFTDFRDQLTRSYPPLNYCVQYRESDFNFVSRLMEQEGIYYFFEHQEGKHVLVLADAMSCHASIPGYSKIMFRPPSSMARDQETINDWIIDQEVQSGVYILNDYDFTKPRSNLVAKAEMTRAHPFSKLAVYDYPGGYEQYASGQAYSRVRLEELQALRKVCRGQTTVRGLAAGYKFALVDHPRMDQNRNYLVVSTSFQAVSDTFESNELGNLGDFFNGNFTAIPIEEVFRPARLTAKPIIQGPQTALVVGPKGEEIHTDAYGRVKVQFHWDRYGQADEKSSCWVRVSQNWAGKKWGSVYIPRIGQEVIVEFLEGDPDKPIVTGCVYNADAMPPYELPAEKTKCTLKSSSSKGGNGFNEIRFEDKKGKEQLFVHAQRNYDIQVRQDRIETIGRNRHLIVKGHKLERINGNRHEIIGKSHYENIDQDHHVEIGGEQAVLIRGAKSLTVDGNVTEVFQANHSEEVWSDYYLVADNLVLEANSNITIRVGDSFIAIEKGGIRISSPGQIAIEAGANVSVKGNMATIKGRGLVVIQGGLVKIN